MPGDKNVQKEVVIGPLKTLSKKHMYFRHLLCSRSTFYLNVRAFFLLVELTISSEVAILNNNKKLPSPLTPDILRFNLLSNFTQLGNTMA